MWMWILAIALIIIAGIVANFFVFIEIRDREYSWSIAGSKFDHVITRIVICVLAVVPWGISIVYGTIFAGGILGAWAGCMIDFIKEP